uniref:Intimal thickness related receptor IRP domain-containing protein n=1 Tax=Oryza punctata TaxID=4537 RepID=A0A0E0L3H4_ORYPU
MAAARLLLLLLAVAAVSLAPPAAAEIRTETFREDPRPTILFEKFGFSKTGAVRIVITGAGISSTFARPDPKQLGFFLLSDESMFQAIYEAQARRPPEKREEVAGGGADEPDVSRCILTSPYVKTLFTFHDLKRGHYNKTFPVTHPDEYSLYFANCAPESLVTMRVRTEMYNGNADGSVDYLPVGQAPVPAIYGVFAFCYAAFLAAWGYLTLSRDRVTAAHQIHHLMSGLLAARLLYCLSAAEDQHYIRVTGTPHGWDVAFYLFQLVKGVVLFAVIVLVGTGWSFLKPVLQDREKKVLMVVIPLQVMANIASAVIGETGPFLQGIVVYALKTIASYQFRWVSILAEEAATLAFYLFMFYTFRPAERSRYFSFDEDEEEAAEMVLREEEFEL